MNALRLIRTYKIPEMCELRARQQGVQLSHEVQAYVRNNISRMTSAGDEALKLALEALTASIPIITSSKVANAKAGEYIIAHLDCGCRFSEQRQLTKTRTTLLECVLSLGQLIEVKHAKCIADRAVSNAAAAAVAAQKESLTGTFFGTMMNASAAQATSERRVAGLLAARELVKSSKQAVRTTRVPKANPV